MEIKITSKQILKFLHVLSWIIFLAVCVDAGAIICTTIYALAYNPSAAGNYWQDVDLSVLFNTNNTDFITITILMSIAAVLKAIIFWQIVKLLYKNKLNMDQPFSPALANFAMLVGWLSIGTALFSGWGVDYSKYIVQKGITMPTAEQLNIDGADVWVFMGVILFVIAQIFKRGIEIQAENELTV